MISWGERRRFNGFELTRIREVAPPITQLVIPPPVFPASFSIVEFLLVRYGFSSRKTQNFYWPMSAKGIEQET
jgi:hypothetical protein